MMDDSTSKENTSTMQTPNPNERFTITLRIGGLEFKPRILRSEEEVYRRAADEINEAFDRYIKRYPKVDRDTILMALSLQFAVNNIKSRRKLSDFVAEINEVNLDLEEFLKQE